MTHRDSSSEGVAALHGSSQTALPEVPAQKGLLSGSQNATKRERHTEAHSRKPNSQRWLVACATSAKVASHLATIQRSAPMGAGRRRPPFSRCPIHCQFAWRFSQLGQVARLLRRGRRSEVWRFGVDVVTTHSARLSTPQLLKFVLVLLRYHAHSFQRGPIVIFSLVRSLGQFDFFVLNLLVRNEIQDV